MLFLANTSKQTNKNVQQSCAVAMAFKLNLSWFHLWHVVLPAGESYLISLKYLLFSQMDAIGEALAGCITATGIADHLSAQLGRCFVAIPRPGRW